MKALLFGSIGTVVDSSRLQREAYNRAFEEIGLDWRWDEALYRSLLTIAGGRERMRRYAAGRGEEIDEDTIARVHERKTVLFGEALDAGEASARPGVLRLVEAAGDAGVALGFVTSTEIGNVERSARAAGLDLERFGVVTHRGNVDAVKPDPAPYRKAIAALGASAHDAVAIEDTEVCLPAPSGAGCVCVATPNAYAGGQDFSAADAVIEHLGDPDRPARALGGHDVLSGGVVTLETLAALIETVLGRERDASAVAAR